MKKHTRFVDCVSSQEQQIMLLKSLLNIVGNRMESENVWAFAEGDQRDVLVLDFDDESNVGLASRISDVLVVAFSRDANRLNGQRFTLMKPLRSKDMLHLLSELDDHLHQVPAVQPESSTPPLVNGKSGNHLDQILSSVRKSDSHLLELDFDGMHSFLDVDSRKIYLDSGFSFASAASCTRFSCADTQAIAKDGLSCVSLADFFYEYTLSTRDAVLLSGINQNSIFSIRQWPQFMKASNTKALIKLSAYFSRRRNTLQAAANELLIGMHQLVAYMNAAHAQDLLVFEAAAAPAAVMTVATPMPATAPVADTSAAAKGGRGLGGLFSKIRQKLGI